jgi:hypothetical protein
MVYRYISSKVIITRLERYFKDSNWKSAAKLDIGDAIQEIGYSSRQNQPHGSVNLDIVGHKAELPCDLEVLIKVEYDGARLPISNDNSLLAITCDDYTWGKANIEDFYMIEYPLIVTSFETGTIRLFYKKFDFDGDNFITIPDISEYRKAIEWYVMSSLLLQGYKLTNNNINHSYCIQMFESYKRKAKSKIKTLSRDERENFSRMWNSLNTNYVESNNIDTE